MADKRSTIRKQTSAPGMVRSGHAKVPCTILDVSPMGARIRLGVGVFMARECVIEADLFREQVTGRIVWRRGSEIGMRFNAVALRREADVGRTKGFALGWLSRG